MAGWSLRCSPVASIIDTVANVAKRRGLVFQAGEIYGGTKSAWDARTAWRGTQGEHQAAVVARRGHQSRRRRRPRLRPSSCPAKCGWPPATSRCSTTRWWSRLITHKRYREDHLIPRRTRPSTAIRPANPGGGRHSRSRTPVSPGNEWTEPREFNMMLKTHLGPIETEEGLHYLRPETAQGIFVNFANVVTTARRKPPFGIGQIGKSFRNEITPGNFIFRTREFEQMEMEFFVEPAKARQGVAPVLDRYPAAVVCRPRYRCQEPSAVRASQGQAVALLRPHRRHRIQVRVPGQPVAQP